MRFEYPHILWALLIFVPALVLFFWWAQRAKAKLVAQFIAARLLSSLTVGVSTGRQKARLALIVAAVALLIVALARPQIGFSYEEAHSRGLDIVVAIDTSKSMLATDVAPNRLRRAQLAAMDLKRLARADRLGLVAFAGSAFLQCPLTLDDEAFRQSVESLDVNIIPQGGSAVSEAIAAAKSAFKEGNDNHKVLVIFTDGEDNEGSAVDAAKTAGKEGMRIFTVGVGTANGELLRVIDTQGRSEFIKDSDGNAVKSRLNETLLQDIGRETGGFYMLLSGANTVNVLYERGLAPLPKSDLTSQRIKRHHERYQWLLGAILVLLLIEMLLPERGRQGQKKDTLTSATTVVLPTALLVAVCWMPIALEAAETKSALNAFKEGNFPLAQSLYENALNEKPADPRLHFNASAAAYEATNFTAALSHLNAALTNANVNLQQQIYYNLGNTLYRVGEANGGFAEKEKQWELALKSFQNASALKTNDTDAVFNANFVQTKIAELKELQRLIEEARKAKRRAEDAIKRRDYEGALRIMAPALSNTNVAKEFGDFVQRLQQINEINKPPQSPQP